MRYATRIAKRKAGGAASPRSQTCRQIPKARGAKLQPSWPHWIQMDGSITSYRSSYTVYRFANQRCGRRAPMALDGWKLGASP